MSKKQKKSFVLYHSFYDVIQDLSDQDAGLLLKAVFEYHINGFEIELPPVLKMAFLFIRSQLDRDREKYRETCEKRAAAGRKGGHQKQANLANASKPNKSNQDIANLANLADNDDDNDDDKKKNIKKKNDFSFPALENEFESFWKLYPARNGRKVGKAVAKKLFIKFDAPDRELIFQAVDNYAESGQLPKDAERFLKNDYWRDWIQNQETPPEQSKPVNSDIEMLRRAANQ